MSLQVSNNYFNIDELKMKSTIFDNSSAMMHISLWFLSSSRRTRWKDETVVKEDKEERKYSLGTRRKERGRDGDDLSRKRGEIFQIN